MCLIRVLRISFLKFSPSLTATAINYSHLSKICSYKLLLCNDMLICIQLREKIINMFVCTFVVYISISRISIYMYHHCCLSSVYHYYRHLIYHWQFLKIIFLFSLNKILSALRWIIIVIILIIVIIINL